MALFYWWLFSPASRSFRRVWTYVATLAETSGEEVLSVVGIGICSGNMGMCVTLRGYRAVVVGLWLGVCVTWGETFGGERLLCP
jgi:hypothetical protein